MNSTIIPSQIFAPQAATGSFYTHLPYPQKISTLTALTHLCEDLNLSAYRLSKLLGMNTSHTVLKWMGGKGNPSPYYLTLMLELSHLVQSRQLDLRLVDSIDWTTGDVFYKGGLNGNDNNKNGVSASQRQISPHERGNRSAVAQFHNQSPG